MFEKMEHNNEDSDISLSALLFGCKTNAEYYKFIQIADSYIRERRYIPFLKFVPEDRIDEVFPINIRQEFLNHIQRLFKSHLVSSEIKSCVQTWIKKHFREFPEMHLFLSDNDNLSDMRMLEINNTRELMVILENLNEFIVHYSLNVITKRFSYDDATYLFHIGIITSTLQNQYGTKVQSLKDFFCIFSARMSIYSLHRMVEYKNQPYTSLYFRFVLFREYMNDILKE